MKKKVYGSRQELLTNFCQFYAHLSGIFRESRSHLVLFVTNRWIFFPLRYLWYTYLSATTPEMNLIGGGAYNWI